MDNKSVLYQLMDTRMGEALHKITKEDTAFMQTKEKADKYAAKLASLNLPEETMRLIDQYVNERSANWVRYGELAYMLGFSDCKELLLGSRHIPEMKDKIGEIHDNLLMEQITVALQIQIGVFEEYN